MLSINLFEFSCHLTVDMQFDNERHLNLLEILSRIGKKQKQNMTCMRNNNVPCNDLCQTHPQDAY